MSRTNSLLGDAQKPQEKKEEWTDRFGFVLSVMGYNIGLGNVLRFPYLVMKNGGGAFIIPYFVFLLLIGVPLFVLELSLGQYSGKSALLFYDNICPLIKGIGWSNVILCGMFNIYYLVQLSWILWYLVHSWMSPLPWTYCHQAWNASQCAEMGDSPAYSLAANLSLAEKDINCSSFNTSERQSSSELFYERNLLQLSASISDLGGMRWDLIPCLAAAWLIVYLCLIRGVRSLGKVVYVTALGPYVFLLVLLVRGLLLPGGRAGVLYYVTPDWGHLATPAPWIEAAQQIFYSLGPTWGGTICMAAHNKFTNNIYRDGIMLPIVCALTSFFAGFVTFAYMGDLALRQGLPISCVLKAGPGLAFVIYPTAFETLPLPQLWSAIFFVLLVFLALDSSFTTFEAMYTSLKDAHPELFRCLRWPWLAKLVVCVVSMIVGLPILTKAGLYFYTLIDWYQVLFMMLVAFIEVVGISYAYGTKRIKDNIYLMTGVRMTYFWDIIWRAVLPAVLMVLFVLTVKDQRTPEYGGYKFPPASVAVGWLIASSTIIPCITSFVWALLTELNSSRRQRTGETCKQTLRRLVTSKPEWEREMEKNLRLLPKVQARYAKLQQEQELQEQQQQEQQQQQQQANGITEMSDLNGRTHV